MQKRYDGIMLRALILVTAVSLDGFAAALGMGSAGIKIPFRSAVVISFTGTLFLAVSAAAADIARYIIPQAFCSAASFILLTALGIFNIFKDSFKKLLIGKDPKGEEPAMLIFDGTAADKDHSKSISVKEAAALSIVLSADSAVTGLSAGLGEISLPILAVMTFAAGLLSTAAGQKLGRMAASAQKADFGKICGILLIILAAAGAWERIHN